MNSEFRTLDLHGCDLRLGDVVAGGAMTAQLEGEIDLANADLVLEVLARALATTAARSFELDIAGVAFADARGVRVFAALASVAEGAGVGYRVVGAQRQVRRVFELTSLTALLDVIGSGRQQHTEHAGDSDSSLDPAGTAHASSPPQEHRQGAG